MAATTNHDDISSSISRILNEKRHPEHLETLKMFTNSLRDKNYRDVVDADIFSTLLKVFSRLKDDLLTSTDEDPNSVAMQLHFCAECFRVLRNSCVQSSRNQSLLRELGFLDLSIELLRFLHANPKIWEGIFESLRCGIQFLGNISVANQMCKDDIWRRSFPDLLLQLLNVDDERTVCYTSMLLYTCLDEAKVEELSQLKNIQIARRVLELCGNRPELDWTVLIATQHFLKSSSLVENMYSAMPPCERLTLLELISAQLSGGDSLGDCISPGVARFLASSFQKGGGAILSLANSATDEPLQEALTVMSLLDVLCEMTSHQDEFTFLQDQADLLVTTIELLKQVHTIGKTSQNVFSPAQNFDVQEEDQESSRSPVTSFKAHLVRLVANLCYRHPNNQNKVRELEGIPLILDNCRIDSNNPFISQWAILAIRNLFENNKKNQEVLITLERKGQADYSALRDLGFDVVERDGALLLKTTGKDA
ncbi:ataxin-10 isoform X2 [Stigmatopora nigra]